MVNTYVILFANTEASLIPLIIKAIYFRKLKGERQKGKRVSLLSCLMRSAKGPLLFAILLTYLSVSCTFL